LTIAGSIQKFHPESTVSQLADSEWLKAQIKASGEEAQPGGVGALQLQPFEACAESLLWEGTTQRTSMGWKRVSLLTLYKKIKYNFLN
jgi:lysyl-tRNA synthetase class 2